MNEICYLETKKTGYLKTLQCTQPNNYLLWQSIVHVGPVASRFLLSASLVLSRPHLLAENIWWFDLNFLSQRRVQQMHNYCAKNAII